MKFSTPILSMFAILLSVVAVQAGEISGTVKMGRDNSNAVVYVDVIKGKTFAPPTEKPKMDQKQMTFIPHVLPILLGTTVEFHNSDTVLHNVFTPSKAGDKFNLGTWPQGIVKTYTFKKPGVVALLCNVHPEMSAYIIVVQTPFFDVTDKEGNFSIANVPAGSYTLMVWHERLRKNLSKSVTVPEKGSVQVDFQK